MIYIIDIAMSLIDIAKKISDDVISIDESILATSVMDMQGKMLASQFKQIFRDKFEVTIDDKKNMHNIYKQRVTAVFPLARCFFF